MEEEIVLNDTEELQSPKESKGRYRVWIRLTALVLVIAILMNLTSVDFTLLRYQGTDQMTAAKYLMSSTPYLGGNRLQRLKSLLTSLDAFHINLQAAEIAIGKTEYEDAAKFLNKCIPQSLDDDQKAELYNRLGCVYMLSGDVAQAQQAFDNSLAIDPEKPIPYLLRGQLRYQDGDIAGATEDAGIYLELGGEDSEMLATAASICELGGNLEGALEAMNRQIDASSEDDQKALAYAERGRIRYLMGQEELATADISQAKSLNREVLTGVHYAIIGLAEYNAGDYEHGGRDFLQAARLSEEGNAAYYEQAVMCGYLSQDYDFLRMVLKEAREKDSMTASSLLIEGILMFAEERYEEAETALSECIASGDIAVGTYYYRGLSRLAQNKYETAAEDFTEALNWEEDKASCRFNRGICYYAMEEEEKAVEDLQYVVSNADEALALSAAEFLEAMELEE